MIISKQFFKPLTPFNKKNHPPKFMVPINSPTLPFTFTSNKIICRLYFVEVMGLYIYVQLSFVLYDFLNL